MQELYTKRHVVYSLHIHLVFVIKYREKVFTEKIYERLHFHFERVCNNFGSKLENQRGEELLSPSYFIASCGGTSLDIVKKYIENQ